MDWTYTTKDISNLLYANACLVVTYVKRSMDVLLPSFRLPLCSSLVRCGMICKLIKYCQILVCIAHITISDLSHLCMLCWWGYGHRLGRQEASSACRTEGEWERMDTTFSVRHPWEWRVSSHCRVHGSDCTCGIRGRMDWLYMHRLVWVECGRCRHGLKLEEYSQQRCMKRFWRGRDTHGTRLVLVKGWELIQREEKSEKENEALLIDDLPPTVQTSSKDGRSRRCGHKALTVARHTYLNSISGLIYARIAETEALVGLYCGALPGAGIGGAPMNVLTV